MLFHLRRFSVGFLHRIAGSADCYGSPVERLGRRPILQPRLDVHDCGQRDTRDRKHLGRITAGSRMPGTRRTYQVTGGYEGTGSGVHEATCGVGRTLEDMEPRRFGTVRPGVQIPGPRPVTCPPTSSVFKIGASGSCQQSLPGRRITISRGAIATVGGNCCRLGAQSR